MRYFNTHGPVEIEKHYVVSRQELVDELKTQIDQGKYFTIYAPRQMGKTTLLRRLDEVLEAESSYLPISLSFERFESWSAADFMDEIGVLIQHHLSQALEANNHPKTQTIKTIFEEQPPVLYRLFERFFRRFYQKTQTTKTIFEGQPPVSYRLFERFFRRLYQIVPDLKIVLVIDEFDATPQEAISPLLQMWRTMYLDPNPPHALHSIILIGIQNIARLNFGRSSPFNIAYQQRLSLFSLDEVRDLIGQYTIESEQQFEPDALAMLHEQTAGHPFLVNRTAAILTEELVTDRSVSITVDHLRVAFNRLIRETNYNFETIIRHANNYRDDVLNILLGGTYRFNLNDPLVSDLYMQGVIHEDEHENSKIANAIYSEVLLAAFRPARVDFQATILVNGYDFRPHAVDGQLEMGALLSRFREFVERRGQEAFKVSEMPQEATGQYLLMAYLDLVVRQLGGDLFTEVDSGDGRIDLIVVYQGHRYVIETKIWRGQAAFDKGLTQLADYLMTEGVGQGYYVIFHARPNVYGKLTYEELEFDEVEAGKQIAVYLVRLAL